MTILPAMTFTDAVATPRPHRVAGLIGRCTALVTARRDRSSLWSSMAMRTGNGSYDFSIRGESHICIISRTSWIAILSQS